MKKNEDYWYTRPPAVPSPPQLTPYATACADGAMLLVKLVYYCFLPFVFVLLPALWLLGKVYQWVGAEKW